MTIRIGATPGAYDGLIATAATRYGVPPEIIRGVIEQESQWDPRARREEPQIADRSRGLMQLLEATARGLGYTGAMGPVVGGSYGGYFPLVGLYDPATSIELGTKLLRANYDRARPSAIEDRWTIALSIYNAGGSLQRPGDAKRTPAGVLVNATYPASVLAIAGRWAQSAAAAVSSAATSSAAAVSSAATTAAKNPGTTSAIAVGVLVAGISVVLLPKLSRGPL